MEITLAPERLFLLEERLTLDEITQRAMDKRTSALGSLLSKPKPEEVTLVNKQRRLEPFWHVAGHAIYVYERNREYSVPAAAPDVEGLTITGTKYEGVATGATRAFRVPALEHCRTEIRSESFVYGLTGAAVADGAQLIGGPRSEIADPQTLAEGDTIALPPENRASYVVRALMGELIKPVQADKVLEEEVVLEATDLFYRPVWAFEFTWNGKGKNAIIEIDSVTGQTRTGKALVSQIRGALNRDLLFDVGADTIGLFVPGGSIAVKLAKAAIDSNKKK
ncbi:MAG: hypothetical protein QFC55_08490 [Chloroflexota bacterium]|nr:hypothetical protein [Chloroflexota bacterium]